MPLVFEVVFVDKIVGNDRRVIIEYVSLSCDFNLNEIRKKASAKLCKYLDCSPDEFIFRSIKVI